MINFGKFQVLFLEVIFGELLARIDYPVWDLHYAAGFQD
jgi:hypothetical protein